MNFKEIDWEKIEEIDDNSGNDDEYTALTWGSREDIFYLVKALYSMKERIEETESSNLVTVFGVPIERIKEIIGVFQLWGYDITTKEGWENAKIGIFGRYKK